MNIDLKRTPRFLFKSKRQLSHAGSVKRHYNTKLNFRSLRNITMLEYLLRRVCLSDCNNSDSTWRYIMKFNIKYLSQVRVEKSLRLNSDSNVGYSIKGIFAAITKNRRFFSK